MDAPRIGFFHAADVWYPFFSSLLISNAEMTFNPKATEEPTWNKEVEIQRARLIGGDELVNKLIIKYQERQSELDDADKDDRLESRAEDELANIDMECAVCFEPFGDDERVTSQYLRQTDWQKKR